MATDKRDTNSFVKQHYNLGNVPQHLSQHLQGLAYKKKRIDTSFECLLSKEI
jgi:hypothetical protein